MNILRLEPCLLIRLCKALLSSTHPSVDRNPRAELRGKGSRGFASRCLRVLQAIADSAERAEPTGCPENAKGVRSAPTEG